MIKSDKNIGHAAFPIKNRNAWMYLWMGDDGKFAYPFQAEKAICEKFYNVYLILN